MFLADPCSYLLRSQSVAVILLILRAICLFVRGSTGPSPVHAPCRRCSDIATSCPGLGANEFTTVS